MRSGVRLRFFPQEDLARTSRQFEFSVGKTWEFSFLQLSPLARLGLSSFLLTIFLLFNGERKDAPLFFLLTLDSFSIFFPEVPLLFLAAPRLVWISLLEEAIEKFFPSLFQSPLI